MQNELPTSQHQRRSAVFRLRPLPVAPPLGQRAYLAHGQANLPELQVRSSDVLCVSDCSVRTGPEVFEPRSPGHPMLGHRQQGELRSLPANLPCSDSLWAPVGSVAAIWRRSFSSRPGPSPAPASPGPAASPPVRRAVCVRIPQAALALVRSEHPELLGAQLQAAPQPSGTVLVFPGASASARPVAQASPRDLQQLADQLAELLGPGAQVLTASPTEVLVCTWRELDLSRTTLLARSLAGRLRLPICVAVADGFERVQQVARSLGGDQLLFVLPPAASGQPSVAPSQPVARWEPGPALVPSQPSRSPAVVYRDVTYAPSASAWPTPPAPKRRCGKGPAASPGVVQLSLFDQAEAA